MKHLLLTIVILFSSILSLCSQGTGYVNFTLETTEIQPQEKYKQQPVELLGCNTVVTNKEKKYWKNAPQGLDWKKKNQVFENLPYGYQFDDKHKKNYYVSKYYIASPPVFIRDKKGKPTKETNYDVGIVTPDQFTFRGEKPVTNIYLEYDILKLVKIQYIPIKLNKSFKGKDILGIPFSVECKDFPRKDKGMYKNAKGASGIGYIDLKAKHGKQFFLPYFEEGTDKKYLNCELSILDDILLNYTIYFKVNGEKRYTIDLKEFYQQHRNDKKLEIELFCEPRDELPCGCVPPDKVKEVVK